MNANVAPLVAAGVALIEAKRPGAVALLDPAVLRVDSSCDCPLGQTWGSYVKGKKALRLDETGALQHGFTWPASGYAATRSCDFIEGLNAEWRRVIAARRAVL
jgi:hypothetical protein